MSQLQGRAQTGKRVRAVARAKRGSCPYSDCAGGRHDRREDKFVGTAKVRATPPDFFRDLTATQRISVLVKLNALPPQWQDTLMHSAEQQILDSLHLTNRLAELEAAMNEVLGLDPNNHQK